MKANVLLNGLLALCLLASCNNDEVTEPSGLEKNWYVIEYDPDADELDALIYDVYKRSGLPIFYNDTIGTQTRYDKGGNPYTYYEILKLGYTYTSMSTSKKFTLEKDRERLLLMTETLDKYAITPYFKKSEDAVVKGAYGPLAFMVVDSLVISNRLDTMQVDLGVNVLSTRTTMSRGKDRIPVDMMTEEEKKAWGWNLAMSELLRYLQNTAPEQVTAYFDLTKKNPDLDGNKKDLFEINKSGASYNYVNEAKNNGIKEYNFDLEEPRKYGVWNYQKIAYSNVYFPNFLQDLSDFMKVIHTKTAEEVKRENAEFPLLLERYDALVQLLKDCGLEHFIKTAS